MSRTDLSDAVDGRAHLEAVDQVELPARVERLADAYDREFDDRDRFLWRWIYSLFPEFTLSSVADEHREHVRTQKTVLTMYVTVLDDLLETHGDRRTFREACRLHRGDVQPDPDRAGVDEATLGFLERTWESFRAGLDGAPRRETFGDVFEYDLDQTTNAVEYSAVVSDNPTMATVTGTRRYDAHNMVMFAYADVDLMYSPGFDLAEFGALRDLLWDLQEMARIGNWLTTWERELAEGDYSAGVVVAAIEDGVVTPADLETDDHRAVVERIRSHGVERRFRQRWRDLHQSVVDREFETESVDLGALARGMETVFEYHQASEGLK